MTCICNMLPELPTGLLGLSKYACSWILQVLISFGTELYLLEIGWSIVESSASLSPSSRADNGGIVGREGGVGRLGWPADGTVGLPLAANKIAAEYDKSRRCSQYIRHAQLGLLAAAFLRSRQKSMPKEVNAWEWRVRLFEFELLLIVVIEIR